MLGLWGTIAAAESGSQDHPNFADVDHNHSDEYGAITQLGENAPMESITVEDLRAKDKPITEVRAYGAVGDGETDDYETIQAAVDDTAESDVVFFPPGAYHCSDAITFSDDAASLTLLGGGMGVSEPVFDGDDGGVDAELAGPWHVDDTQTLTVRGLTLTTTQSHDTALLAEWPLYNRSTQNATCTIQNVGLRGSWETGISLFHAWNTAIDTVRDRGGNDSEVAIELRGRCVDSVVENILIYGYGTGVSVGLDSRLPTEGSTYRREPWSVSTRASPPGKDRSSPWRTHTSTLTKPGSY